MVLLQEVVVEVLLEVESWDKEEEEEDRDKFSPSKLPLCSLCPSKFCSSSARAWWPEDRKVED